MNITLWHNNGKLQCDFKMPLPAEHWVALLSDLGITVISSESRKWPGATIALCAAPSSDGYIFECSGISRAQLRDAGQAGFRVFKLSEADLDKLDEIVTDVAEAGAHGLLLRVGSGDTFPWMSIAALDGPGDHFPLDALKKIKLSVMSGDSEGGVAIASMIGCRLRVIKPNDMITGDFDASRVNIFVADDGRIESVSFG